MKVTWERQKLGDLIDLQNGFAFDSKKFGSDGVPLIRIRDLKNGVGTETNYSGDYDEKYVVHAGDFLIGMDGEFRCHEWRGHPALLNQRVCRLQGFKGKLDPKFLFYGINSYLKAIEDVTSFATVKHLSSKQILGIEIPAPSIKEQQRIVAILDEAFVGIATVKANAEKNLQNARELFDSELSSVFIKLADEAPQRVLSSLCRRITVGHVGSMASRYKDSGVVFLRSQNVRPFEIDLKNAVFIDEDFHAELSKSRLTPGDLAIVRTGYPGTAAVIPESLSMANCSDLVIVRPNEQVCPEYLALFFNSEFGKRLVAGKAVGAAQKHFNVTSAKEVMLPLPSRDEEARVVHDCHRLRNEGIRLERLFQRKLAALDELKQSLLAKAFAGELT